MGPCWRGKECAFVGPVEVRYQGLAIDKEDKGDVHRSGL
jgi:hypothetical protein